MAWWPRRGLFPPFGNSALYNRTVSPSPAECRFHLVAAFEVIKAGHCAPRAVIGLSPDIGHSAMTAADLGSMMSGRNGAPRADRQPLGEAQAWEYELLYAGLIHDSRETDVAFNAARGKNGREN